MWETKTLWDRGDAVPSGQMETHELPSQRAPAGQTTLRATQLLPFHSVPGGQLTVGAFVTRGAGGEGRHVPPLSEKTKAHAIYGGPTGCGKQVIGRLSHF
jgi:hypothetical protein